MALFIYGTANNTGKGFFTAEDRRAFFLRGYPANVWVIGNNEKGALWLAEKNVYRFFFSEVLDDKSFRIYPSLFQERTHCCRSLL